MIELWHIWIIAGLLLWVVEIFTPGFLAGLLGTACLVVAPFAGVDVSVKMQMLVFSLSLLILTIVIRPFVLKYFYKRETGAKTNVDALVGKTGLVIEMIEKTASVGQVKIEGEVWRAVTATDEHVPVGQKVVIREIDGNKVVVDTFDPEK